MSRVFQKAARQQRGFQSRATEAGTCIISCLTLKEIWGSWDPRASTARTATAMPCSRSRTWKVFWKITPPDSGMLTWRSLRISSKRNDGFWFSVLFSLYLRTVKHFSSSYSYLLMIANSRQYIVFSQTPVIPLFSSCVLHVTPSSFVLWSLGKTIWRLFN